VGVDILGQLGTPTYLFPDETLAVLLGMLEREQEPEVLQAIGETLGYSHRCNPRTIEPLAHLKNHADERVRRGVVCSLKEQEDERALFTLLELSKDLAEDVSWEAIAALQRRGGKDVLAYACQFCASGEAHERCVGATILGQLGYKDNYPFCEETLAVLLGMLEGEQEPETLSAITTALGHSHSRDPRTIEPLVCLKDHPDEQVRFGVVFGLLHQEDERAIRTLMDLSTDPDTDVRDWATFGLGSTIEVDTSALREALVARLEDEEGDVRGETMVGLARRHDQRMIEPLLTDLEAGWFGSLGIEAAAEIGDPRLYPVLVRLREEWEDGKDDWLYKMLEEALEKCQPAER
jgi:HEAT repeat protein